MTDTELPPCQLCNHTPARNAVGLLYCLDQNCPLHVPSFTDEQWRALHAPAQVLREIEKVCNKYTNHAVMPNDIYSLAADIRKLTSN